MPERWEKLQEAVAGAERVLILLHDDPDPDAVASGAALRFLLDEALGIDSQIAYRGVIGRAENRALVDYLDVALENLPPQPVQSEWPVAVIDTQPGAGNSPIPASYPTCIVIDHHSEREQKHVVFADVRPWIGASTTILAQYLRTADLIPGTRLATALFYGIKTDTRALSRDTSAADVAAYFYLLPFVDIDAVVEIENAQVPAGYFRNLAKAISNARVYDGLIYSYLGETDYPDLAAEVADLLLRLKGVRWVICLGAFEDEIYLSIRASSGEVDAEKMAKAIVAGEGTAGGRSMLAGGQVLLDGREPEELAAVLRQRVLDYLEIPPGTEGESLVT
ncbi:MAG: DHHA1 domain-containing protein [Anaerolineae bacterium]|nr:DHHA1 domain-containing protein [Anaerolineae bacterium]